VAYLSHYLAGLRTEIWNWGLQDSKQRATNSTPTFRRRNGFSSKQCNSYVRDKCLRTSVQIFQYSEFSFHGFLRCLYTNSAMESVRSVFSFILSFHSTKLLRHLYYTHRWYSIIKSRAYRHDIPVFYATRWLITLQHVDQWRSANYTSRVLNRIMHKQRNWKPRLLKRQRKVTNMAVIKILLHCSTFNWRRRETATRLWVALHSFTFPDWYFHPLFIFCFTTINRSHWRRR
jgi:hypothetical protein